MQRIDLRTPTRLIAMAAVALSLSYITGCLQPTATVKGNVAVLLKADMSGNTKSNAESCLNSSDIASLHVTVDDVQFERLTDTGSELISVLDAPVALDVSALQDIGTVLAATTIPAGDYVGGVILLSNAEASLTSAPDVFLPVALPDNGEIPFDGNFTIGSEDNGVLKLKLERVRICMMQDNSLYLKIGCGFEVEVERHDSSGDDNEHDGYITAESVEAFGKIAGLHDNVFTLKIKDHTVLVDFSQAQILLPPTTDGGDPVVGGPEDLENYAEVLVYGTLALQDDFVILADTVEVVAWAQGGGGDHHGDDDGEDDDHDGEGDDDENGHHGGGGTFDENANTTGFGIPSGYVGNAYTGEDLYASSCAACHPSPYGNVEGEPYGEIKEALHEVSEMSFLDLSRQQIADITAYLNWDGTGTPPPPPPPPPPAAPDAPTNVQASDGAYTDKVAVTWNASADATGYEVWRNTSNNSGSASLLDSSAGTSYDDLTAVVGTTYYYWVKASNTNGTSGFSAPDTGFRADTPPPAPSAPTNVQASDGTFTDKVSVTWNASAGASGYEVWRNTSNNSGSASLLDSPAGTSYDDLTAVQGTTYYYWVKASNLSGTSGFSAPDSGFAAAPSGPFDANGNTTAYDIPSPLVGNITAGETVWNSKCMGCHPGLFGPVGAFTYPAMSNKLATVPLMSGIVVTDQQKADLTAYLNRADATP